MARRPLIPLSWVAVVVLAACSSPRTGSPPDAGPSTRGRAGDGGTARRPTVFDDGFSFTCSPDAEVGCSGVFPVRTGGEAASTVALLSQGQDSLAARIASLRAARRSIRIQALIFRGDETGLYVADLLKQKKAEGVDVRVIVDAPSNLDWQTQWMYFDLKQHGIEVEGYEALYLQWLTAEIVVGDPLRPNKRFHDKMWIIDGEDPSAAVAIVGGLNVANEYFRVDTTPLQTWRDQDVAVRGPVVGDIVRAFDRNYEFFKSIKERMPAIFNPDNAWRLARQARSKVGALRTPSWRRPAVVQTVERVASQVAALDPVPVVARFVQSRPRLRESYIQQTYLDLIGRARSRISIANAYFVPSRAVSEALARAARRGVRVVVVTNSPATNDIAPVATVSRSMYRKLLAGGIAIREWQGAPFGEGTLHAKFAVVDGVEAIVGSYNLDPRSERLNSETALAIRSDAVAGALQRWFEQEYVEKSVAVTAEQAATYENPPDLASAFELAYSVPLRDWL